MQLVCVIPLDKRLNSKMLSTARWIDEIDEGVMVPSPVPSEPQDMSFTSTIWQNCCPDDDQGLNSSFLQKGSSTPPLKFIN